jgi:glyoxylase-like metal-dependent hydrolase (beta-lactamase superfamily II)
VSSPAEVADGLWRWALPHPEWRASEFGREVVSWAVRTPDGVVLVDPLVEEPGALDALDPVAIVITIPYHARSAEPLAERFGIAVYGHPATAKRLGDTSRFVATDPSTALPGGARCFLAGKPKRFEQPVLFPSARALAFGDAVVVNPAGELRVWVQDPAWRREWYDERFLPTLQPLLELDVERILVTHGAPVLRDGAEALRHALSVEPWYHHG